MGVGDSWGKRPVASNQGPMRSSVSTPGFNRLTTAPAVGEQLPTRIQWETDTQLRGVRPMDLRMIDESLGIQERGAAGFAVNNVYSYYPYVRSLTNVYLTTRAWQPRSAVLDSGEAELPHKIKNLTRIATIYLSKLLRCLPEDVEHRIPGLVSMSEHGRKVDFGGNDWATPYRNIIYLEEAERMQLQLEFRAPLVYQMPIYDKTANRDTKIPCDTTTWTDHPSYSSSRAARGGTGGFVLDYNRRLYVSRHATTETWYDIGNKEKAPVKIWLRLFGLAAVQGKSRFFHSSYMAGKSVLCAGSMQISQGKITYINNESGHYEPSSRQLIHVLDTLRANMIPLRGIEVEGYREPVVSAEEFYAKHKGVFGQFRV